MKSQCSPPSTKLSEPQHIRKVLLLQGPAGPFFKNLQYAFDAEGFAVKRVLFHRADQLFAPRDNTYRFSGDGIAWEKWLHTEFTDNRPDIVVLFGSSRPIHITARKVADEFNVTVISLEEGYLRAGYITCETGGNNQYSPLHHWTATSSVTLPYTPLAIPSSFFIMCCWQGIYYLWRSLTESNIEKTLYHRKIDCIFKEMGLWMRHACRRLFAKFANRKDIRKLETEYAKNYLLIPLQTPSDAQVQTAARGWTNEKLVKQALLSLRETIINEPTNKLILVFKTHPLDQTSHTLVSFIKKEAQAMELSDRVIVLESGKMGTLTQHAGGMVVINSTSAFSALHHQVPLLVLGEAIFRRASIATIGDNAESITRFVSHRTLKKSADIEAFINAVKAHALLPGDFYANKTQRVTAQHVVDKAKAQL